MLFGPLKIDGLTLKEHPHVYPVREDSLLLATSAAVRPGERVVEIGCGLGLASLAAARDGGHVLATDPNPYALTAVRKNSEDRSLRLDCLRTDLFRGLRRFDVVMFNPPYLPTRPEEKDDDPWNDLALNGGEDGWAVLSPFLRSLPEHLSPGGRAYILLASVAGSSTDPISKVTAMPGLSLVRIAGERTLQGERLWIAELAARPTA
jgi:release factor glutamine methyltransferase